MAAAEDHPGTPKRFQAGPPAVGGGTEPGWPEPAAEGATHPTPGGGYFSNGMRQRGGGVCVCVCVCACACVCVLPRRRSVCESETDLLIYNK